jgi:hypothetical protein
MYGSERCDGLMRVVSRETFGECSTAEAARLRVMRIYATRLKLVERRDMDSPRRAMLMRMLILLDSAAGRELCALLLDQDSPRPQTP